LVDMFSCVIGDKMCSAIWLLARAGELYSAGEAVGEVGFELYAAGEVANELYGADEVVGELYSAGDVVGEYNAGEV